MSHRGFFYDGESARAVPVQWQVSAGILLIRGEGLDRQVSIAGTRATSRLGAIRRVIHLPGGAQLHSDDNDAVDQLVSPRGLEAMTDRLERHAVAVAASLVITVGLVAWFFTLGLPRLADRAARALPPEVEAAIGGQVITALEKTVLSATTLDEDTQARYRRLFAGFVAGLPDAERYRLEFRYMKGHPANAFALPGGTVLFTDALVELIEEDEEFLAILAHELGHHRERHLTRSVLQSSAVVVLGTVVAGDVSGASAVIVGLPTFLLENHYSRGFEAEADRYAFDQLRERGISPAWFGRIMQRLADDQAGGDEEEAAPEDGDTLLSYASTHPPTPQRIAAARVASTGLPPPGRLIADRVVARLAGDDAAPAAVPDPVAAGLVTGCWSGSYLPEDETEPAEWVQRTDPDGTLVLRTTFPDGDVLRSRGFWAARGTGLVEHLASLDPASGAESAAGVSYAYEMVTATPDRLVYRNVESGEEIEARRAACPEGL